MKSTAVIAAVVVVLLGIAGMLAWFTLGSGHVTYIPSEATDFSRKGEALLNKVLNTPDRQQKVDLTTQAIEALKKAVEVEPTFAVAHNLLGHAYIQVGQWELAIQHLNEALKIRSDYPMALYNRAWVYHKLSLSKKDQKLLDKAIADYQKALRSNLSHGIAGDIYKALADAYQQKGDYEKAIAELRNYLDKAPHAQDAALIVRKIRGLSLMQHGEAPLDDSQIP